MKSATPDPRSKAVADRLALTGYTLDIFCRANIARMNEARKKIYCAIKAIQRFGLALTRRAIQRLTGCSIHTINRHSDILEPAFLEDAGVNDQNLPKDLIDIGRSDQRVKATVSFFASLFRTGKNVYQAIAKPFCQCGHGHDRLPLKYTTSTARRSCAATKEGEAKAEPTYCAKLRKPAMMEKEKSYTWKPTAENPRPPGLGFFQKKEKERSETSAVSYQPQVSPPSYARAPRPLDPSAAPWIPPPAELRAQINDLCKKFSIEQAAFRAGKPNGYAIDRSPADEEWFNRNRNRVNSILHDR